MSINRRRGRLALLVMMAACAFIVGISAQGIPPPPPPPPPGLVGAPLPEGTGAISGLVTDGVSGRLLAGAVVTLSISGARGGTGRVVTDDKGRFIFAKLAASDNYTVTVAKIGYVEARSRVRIALTDGQWFTDAKINLFKFGAISGVVTDEANEPVVGCYVRAIVQVLVAGLPQLAAGQVTRTDDRGVYRMPGLSPGRYLVSVPSVQMSVPADASDAALLGRTPETVANMEAFGEILPSRTNRTLSPDGKNLVLLGSYATPPPTTTRSMAYPPVFYPTVRGPKDATVIELKNGEERTGIDFQLRPVPVVRVSGRLEGPPDAGAAGMTLRLVPAGAEGLGNGSETGTALVAPNGSFTFLNVPSGDYTIIASRQLLEYQNMERSLFVSVTLPGPPGIMSGGGGGGQVASASAGTTYSYSTADGIRTHSGRASVTVGANDVADVLVPLRRAVTVSGKLVYDFERPSGPASRGGWPVYADPADGNAALGMPAGRTGTTPPADTTFSIEGLQPGQYMLRFLGVGGRVKSITMDGKDFTYRPLDASAGRDIDVVVTLTNKTTAVTGYVRDQNQPVKHGNVIFFPVEPEQWINYGFNPLRIFSVAVTTNGAFTVGPPAGVYCAIAVDDSLATAWQDPRFLAAAAPLATKITIEWDDKKTLDLPLQQVPGFRSGGN